MAPTEIAPYRPAQNGLALPSGAPAVKEAMATLEAIRSFVANELVREVDFGVIPGTGSKAVLLLPGAQKIAMYLNTYPVYTIQPTELGDGHVEYLVSTSMVSRSSGQVVASGIGSCSTKEGKYRFRNGERKCPECGLAAIIKGREEYGGGWVCFKKKGGCGAKFDDGDRSIEGQQVGKVENDNIYDQRNTVLKMSKKRSLVDASIGLACLADQFTQDIEDTLDLSATPQPAKALETPAATTADRPGDELLAWAEETALATSKDVKGWIARYAERQGWSGNPLGWDRGRCDQAYEAFNRALAKREAARPAKEAPRPEPPAKPTKGTSWQVFVDESIATWHAFDPIKTDAEAIERRMRLINAIASTAVSDDRIQAGAIQKPAEAGKDPARDNRKTWAAVERLHANDPTYVDMAAEEYLAEKREDMADAVDPRKAG